MTLRLRLYIAAAALLSVVALLGVLLVHSVEHSEFQQIDQQLKTAAPVVGAFDRPTAIGNNVTWPPSRRVDSGLSVGIGTMAGNLDRFAEPTNQAPGRGVTGPSGRHRKSSEVGCPWRRTYRLRRAAGGRVLGGPTRTTPDRRGYRCR